jgi:DNA-binding NarL/FixJ family response regulator
MTATPMRGPTVLSSRRLFEATARRLLVVDDYVAFAEALACRLDIEPGLTAFAVNTIEQARGALSERQFDVLLLDVDLDGNDGLRFAGEALAESPAMRVVVVTGGDDEDRVVEAVRVGVSGWVPKDEPIEHLLTVVRGSLRGETWIPPRLLTHVLAELKSAQRDRSEYAVLLATLTRREKEILTCLVAGMSADAIAGQLYLSRNTVRTHIQNMMGKLKVHSAVAAVAVARRAGLTRADIRPDTLRLGRRGCAGSGT